MGKNVHENILEPIFSENPMIPDSLLKNFIFSCKNNCTKRCGWRKLGLKCNKYCKKCKVNECLNSEAIKDFTPTEISREPEVIEVEVEVLCFMDEEESTERKYDDHNNRSEDSSGYIFIPSFFHT